VKVRELVGDTGAPKVEVWHRKMKVWIESRKLAVSIGWERKKQAGTALLFCQDVLSRKDSTRQRAGENRLGLLCKVEEKMKGRAQQQSMQKTDTSEGWE
jgi:hypothetical protein